MNIAIKPPSLLIVFFDQKNKPLFLSNTFFYFLEFGIEWVSRSNKLLTITATSMLVFSVWLLFFCSWVLNLWVLILIMQKLGHPSFICVDKKCHIQRNAMHYSFWWLPLLCVTEQIWRFIQMHQRCYGYDWSCITTIASYGLQLSFIYEFVSFTRKYKHILTNISRLIALFVFIVIAIGVHGSSCVHHDIAFGIQMMGTLISGSVMPLFVYDQERRCSQASHHTSHNQRVVLNDHHPETTIRITVRADPEN